jgi:hypothetical protein
MKAIWYKFKANEQQKMERVLSSSKEIIEFKDLYINGTDANLENKIDLETFRLRASPNVLIQFDDIFDSTINAVDEFFICEGCGHIYWV